MSTKASWVLAGQERGAAGQFREQLAVHRLELADAPQV